jgi:hypothetical protein
MDTWKVTLGALFLFISSVTVIEAGLVATDTPFVAAAIGSLALAAGSLVFESVSAALSV